MSTKTPTKHTIVFEVDNSISLKDLHELLCLHIHEGNDDAGFTLRQNVIDIDMNRGYDEHQDTH